MPAKILPPYITEEYYNQNSVTNYNNLKYMYNIFNVHDIIEINKKDNIIIINNSNIDNNTSYTSWFSYIYKSITNYI